MKIPQRILLLTLASATTTASTATTNTNPHELTTSSPLGRSLLSQSRLLNNNDDEVSYTWLTNYSLKFQGCRHHTTLNLDADDNNDVRIKTVHMAHFRMCPANTCSTWMGAGCNANYGDYVVDLQTFAKSYLEGKRREEEWACQSYMWDHCDCEDSDDKGDDFNREYCEYDCFAGSGKYKGCIDRNPYEEEEEGEGGRREERFEADRYIECKELELENDDDDANQVQYYIGPYCSNNGGSVYLGLFTDDTCTNFADSNKGRTTYKQLVGSVLPYSTDSLISADCVSCMEQEDPNRRQDENENGNDEEDEDRISDQCERLYESAGKCESSLSGITSDPNNEACSYIGGIKFTKMNGVVDKNMTRHELAELLIIGFAAVFAGLALYVFNLRKKVAQAKPNPLLEENKENNDNDEVKTEAGNLAPSHPWVNFRFGW